MAIITVKQLAAIKRIAQNVAPLTVKKQKLQAKLIEVAQEINDLNVQINEQQGYVKAIANGRTSEDLIVRVVTPYLDSEGQQKYDKQGNALKVTRYEANEEVLTFNAEKRYYELVETTEEPVVEEATEESSLAF